jgi:hypothetical protein
MILSPFCTIGKSLFLCLEFFMSIVVGAKVYDPISGHRINEADLFSFKRVHSNEKKNELIFPDLRGLFVLVEPKPLIPTYI